MNQRLNPSPRQPQSTGRRHALATRERKRAEALELGIDEAFISEMVERFYETIRGDALLGPIFQSRIADWPDHLARMKIFWGSVLHNSGQYSGNPMRKHIAISGLEREHFTRWLALFRVTLDGIERHDGAAELIHGRARMIAESLLHGIAVHRGGMEAACKVKGFSDA